MCKYSELKWKRYDFCKTTKGDRAPVMYCSSTLLVPEENMNPCIFCHSQHEHHFLSNLLYESKHPYLHPEHPKSAQTVKDYQKE